MVENPNLDKFDKLAIDRAEYEGMVKRDLNQIKLKPQSYTQVMHNPLFTLVRDAIIQVDG